MSEPAADPAPIRVLLLGSPGAGKSTVAARLAQRLGLLHLSTGELLRRAMRTPSPLGDAVRPYVERGDLVPDDLILAVVDRVLSSPDVAPGYVLDGFPRTPEQADAFLARHPDGIDVVIELRVPRHEVRHRLLARGRPDDGPAVVERRLAVYDAETAPLRRALTEQVRFVTVDGQGSPAEVTDRVCQAVPGGRR